MSERLSSFISTHAANTKAVDFYQRLTDQIWIIHDGHCPRAHTCDGLCACDDPECFTIAAIDTGRKGRRK